MRKLFLILSVVVLIASTAWAKSKPPAEVIDPVQALQNGFIVARGISKAQPQAQAWQQSEDALLLVARTVAMGKLMETVGKMEISDTVIIKDTLLKSSDLEKRVSGSLEGAHAIHENFDEKAEFVTR